MTRQYNDARKATAIGIEIDPDGTFSHLHDDIENDLDFQLMNRAITEGDESVLDAIIGNADAELIDSIEASLTDSFDAMFKSL